MAIIQDPTGAVFGVWQPINHIGASIVNIPGAWVWNEVMTRDVDAAVAFYSTVFGWTTHSDTDTTSGIPYVMLSSNERAVGGVFQITPEMGDMPANWTVYFHVEDCEAAMEKAQALGGTVLAGPIDSGAGRIAVIRDPQGAVFNVIKATYVDPPPQG